VRSKPALTPPHPLEDVCGAVEHRELLGVEALEPLGEERGLARAELGEQRAGGGGGGDQARAAVVRVGRALHEPFPDQPGEHARRRRPLDPLAGGQLAGGHRAVALDGRERGGQARRELRSRLLAEAPGGSHDRETKVAGELGCGGRSHG
jgi:hypothetical protein